MKPWHLLFVLLLSIPPVARIGLHVASKQDAEALRPDEAPRVELETARSELRRARLDLDVRGLGSLEARYQPVLCDVLPLGDPSPGRSALWTIVRGPRAVPRDTAAVWTGAADPSAAGTDAGQALAGRVTRVYPGTSLVRVETLLDPTFRVRFQLEGASGMLFGTGRESKGCPLLEVRHLSESVDPTPGAAVFTEGDDGVYPPGLLIGFVEREEDTESGRFVVRAALRVEGLTRLVLVVDRALERLTDLRRRESRPGGSP